MYLCMPIPPLISAIIESKTPSVFDTGLSLPPSTGLHVKVSIGRYIFIFSDNRLVYETKYMYQ